MIHKKMGFKLAADIHTHESARLADIQAFEGHRGPEPSTFVGLHFSIHPPALGLWNKSILQSFARFLDDDQRRCQWRADDVVLPKIPEAILTSLLENKWTRMRATWVGTLPRVAHGGNRQETRREIQARLEQAAIEEARTGRRKTRVQTVSS
jgi:hypothetical protein